MIGPQGAGRTLEDSGKPIVLAVGAPLAIKLRTNAGNGFTWDVTQGDPNVLAPVGTPTNEPLDGAQPGGRVQKVFSFVGKAPGTTHLEIVLHRPWEKGPPLKSFTADVTVQ